MITKHRMSKGGDSPFGVFLDDYILAVPIVCDYVEVYL